jgi:RNA polymerase sigma factor (sigma-70 family)
MASRIGCPNFSKEETIDIVRRVMNWDGRLHIRVPEIINKGGETFSIFDKINQETIKKQDDILEKKELERELIMKICEAVSLEEKHNNQTKRERNLNIILMRFGLCEYEPMTHREISERLGITLARVQQIEYRVINKLKKTCKHLKVFWE